MKPFFLCIDFINDIADPKGKIARSAERIAQNKTIAHANEAIAHARKNAWPLAFVKVGFSKGYPECPPSSAIFGAAKANNVLLLSSWGTEFVKDLDVQKDDLILVKHRVSAFYGTALETILRAQSIDTLILTGTATNMAIEHTARDAHDRDYQVIIVEKGCESHTEEAHKASISALSRFCKIVSSL